MSRNALGRGLSALLSESQSPISQTQTEKPEGYRLIPIDRIRPSRYQPRQDIDPDSIRELADSIREHGLLQPIVVSFDAEEDEYELIAGERRFEASRSVGLTVIPAIIQEVEDQARLELGLIENIQRENLNPIEEAKAYVILMEKFNLTQEQMAQRLGRKRTSIANTLRLLSLPEDIQADIATGVLSAGHAKALAAIEDPEQLRQAVQRLREGALNVRETEALVRQIRESSGKKKKSPSSRRSQLNPDLQAVVDSLQDFLGTRVKIALGKGGHGKIEIEYYSEDDLQRILDVMGISVD